MSKAISWISGNINQLTHFFKKNLHLYKNSWGICILADLNCGEGETVFNKEVEKIVAELKKDQRNYYLTLIII